MTVIMKLFRLIVHSFLIFSESNSSLPPPVINLRTGVQADTEFTFDGKMIPSIC